MHHSERQWVRKRISCSTAFINNKNRENSEINKTDTMKSRRKCECVWERKRNETQFINSFSSLWSSCSSILMTKTCCRCRRRHHPFEMKCHQNRLVDPEQVHQIVPKCARHTHSVSSREREKSSRQPRYTHIIITSQAETWLSGRYRPFFTHSFRHCL